MSGEEKMDQREAAPVKQAKAKDDRIRGVRHQFLCPTVSLIKVEPGTVDEVAHKYGGIRRPETKKLHISTIVPTFTPRISSRILRSSFRPVRMATGGTESSHRVTFVWS